ncbi:MAG: AAA family ATPase [Bacteriovoracaceae bacterium]
MKQFDSVVLGALDIAQTEALSRKNSEITPYHLFWGLLSNPQTFSAKSLKKYKNEVKGALDKLPTVSGNFSLDQLRQSSGFAEWITLASSHAVQSSRQEITETDLLRFLPKVLKDIKINYEDFNKLENSEEQEVPSFLVNLNELAEKGKLDPVIGRTKEIRAVMEILGRRGKNNPVLVGSAGVGKTAIVEGLADLIVRGKVPEDLKGKTVYSLDMGSLVAGTKFRGEFEERLQKLLKFMKGEAGKSILFIDEIHMLVGAGKTDGAMDAANLLKPALARGDLHCIGATTPNEFQKFILGYSALERRFRSVPVEEPTLENSG